MIADGEGSSPIRQAEVEAAKRMVDRAQDHHHLRPRKLVADAAYGSAEPLKWLVDEKGIEPHIPVFGKSDRQDGTFSRGDFIYEAEQDRYVCPPAKTFGNFALQAAPRRRSRQLMDCCAIAPARPIAMGVL